MKNSSASASNEAPNTTEREVKWRGPFSNGKHYPYLVYEVGDRICQTINPEIVGTVVAGPGDTGIMGVSWDHDVGAQLVAAYNCRPIDITITEDPT